MTAKAALQLRIKPGRTIASPGGVRGVGPDRELPARGVS